MIRRFKKTALSSLKRKKDRKSKTSTRDDKMVLRLSVADSKKTNSDLKRVIMVCGAHVRNSLKVVQD